VREKRELEGEDQWGRGSLISGFKEKTLPSLVKKNLAFYTCHVGKKTNRSLRF